MSNTPDGGARERIDRALLRDARQAARSRALWAFAAVFALASAMQVLRGGTERLGLIATIVLGIAAFSILAWFAGRHRSAVTKPSAVRWPVAEGITILVAYTGLVLWLFGHGTIGGALFLAGIGAAALVLVRAGYRPADFRWLLYSAVPFLAFALAVAIPKVALQGPVAFLTGVVAGLFSGVFQQVMLLEGVVARWEVFSRRTDVAAVLGALAFGVAHAPINMAQAQGDHLLALSAAFVFQAPIGLVFILGYVRHRAALVLGVIHAIALA